MRTLLVISSSFVLFSVIVSTGAVAADGRLQFRVNDAQGQPLPCRIHVADGEGKAWQAAGLPFWRDHFVCSGQAALELPPGTYRYTVERGPEYESASGSVDIASDGQTTRSLELNRIANLRDSGWYSADLHVHRAVSDIELLMSAEDLDYAPVITWWNRTNPWTTRAPPESVLRQFDGHRLYHVMAGEDEREGGALLYFGLRRPIDITQATREFPSAMHFVRQAKIQNANVWIDMEKPFWWDVPTWLATGQMQSIGLANNHMWRSEMLPNEAWGKPRDTERLPNPLGNGYWTQEIYYHILNSGLRIPPSAGSASGVLGNPVGYNRVFAKVDGEFTEDAWWSSLARGNCFVTNGPLIVCHANDQLPGTVFQMDDGDRLLLELKIELLGRDRVEHVEVIKNGIVAQTLDCSAAAFQQLTTKLSFSEPGWFLIRAIADNDATFRFGSTGPYYVEFPGNRHRISRASTVFFEQWVAERIDRVRRNVTDPQQLDAVLQPHETAREFWKQRRQMANVDD